MTEENKNVDLTQEHERLKTAHQNAIAKLTDLEKRFGNVNVDKLKADSEALGLVQKELDEIKKTKATAGNAEAFAKEWEKREKELTDKHRAAFEEAVNPLKDKLTKYESEIYERDVVDGALNKISSGFVKGSEEFLKEMIRKEIKKDAETGELYIVDSKGQRIYKDGATPLTVAEWVDIKKKQYPFMAADSTVQGTHSAAETKQTSSAGAKRPPRGASEEELIKFYQENPDVKVPFLA